MPIESEDNLGGAVSLSTISVLESELMSLGFVSTH